MYLKINRIVQSMAAAAAIAMVASAVDSWAWVRKYPKGRPPLAFYALLRAKVV